jgi:hypothetical protein
MPVSPADLVLSCQLTCRQRSKTRPTSVIKVLRRPVESACWPAGPPAQRTTARRAHTTATSSPRAKTRVTTRAADPPPGPTKPEGLKLLGQSFSRARERTRPHRRGSSRSGVWLSLTYQDREAATLSSHLPAETWWAQVGSNHRPLACKGCHHHSPTCGSSRRPRSESSRDEHSRAPPSSGEQSALPLRDCSYGSDVSRLAVTRSGIQ